jgi:hypothetical protein
MGVIKANDTGTLRARNKFAHPVLLLVVLVGIELSTRHHFAHWPPQGEVLRGWARGASGDIAEGLSWIVDGIEEFRATSALRGLPFFLALKAEALHLAIAPLKLLRL